MIGLYIVFAVALVLFILFSASYFVYRKVFASQREKTLNAYEGIERRRYRPYKEEMSSYIETFLRLPYENVFVKSGDGLTLHARYYHNKDGAPIEILAHGYRSNPHRDFSLSAQRVEAGERNFLLIDQRAHGESEGKSITFGIMESEDILFWIEYLVSRFGQECRIILYGISMGAASVLMTAGKNPSLKNISCVIADCPYSSPLKIISEVGVKSKLPKPVISFFVKIAAFVFADFIIASYSPLEALKNTNIPVLLIHGDSDSLVPHSMSLELAAANPSVRLETFSGAEHATSCFFDTGRYISLIEGFIKDSLK